LIVIALQFTTGVSTIYLSWPLALAVIHNGGAALLTLLLTVVNYRAYISSRLRLPHAAAPRTASASA
jgi:cytochrome c oxidase assembly protein subunit 15